MQLGLLIANSSAEDQKEAIEHDALEREDI